MSSSRVARVAQQQPISRFAGWLPYTRIRRAGEEIQSAAGSPDSAVSAAVAEIEHPYGAQLAPLDMTDGNQVALARCIGRAGVGRRIAAADQHGLPAQQTGCIVLAHAQ